MNGKEPLTWSNYENFQLQLNAMKLEKVLGSEYTSSGAGFEALPVFEKKIST